MGSLQGMYNFLGKSFGRGTATGGTKTTLIDTKKVWEDDMLNDTVIRMTIGGIDYFRKVTNTTAASSTITFATLPGTPASCVWTVVAGHAITTTSVADGGNDYIIKAALAVGNNKPLAVTLVGNVITIALATGAGGASNDAANTAVLVAAAIDTLAEFTSAVTTGDGSGVVPVTASVAFTGGIDEVKPDSSTHYEVTSNAGMSGTKLSGSKTPDYTIPVMDITAWSGFANQPNNDGIEVISNSASDTQKITIFGTTVTTGVFCYETITLNGVGAVATTKVNWGNIVGAFLGEIDGTGVVPAVGTIIIREASADQTITTIAAGKISKGMVVFDLDGEDLSIVGVSGNTYAKQFVLGATTLVTTANGYLINLTCGNIVDCTPKANNLIGFISDASSATMQILVWE